MRQRCQYQLPTTPSIPLLKVKYILTASLEPFGHEINIDKIKFSCFTHNQGGNYKESEPQCQMLCEFFAFQKG